MVDWGKKGVGGGGLGPEGGRGGDLGQKGVGVED